MDGLKHKILVIDDERQIRKFLRITLGAADYKVEEAEKGEEGLRLANSIKPDIIICDLGLPDIDGNDVISSIRVTLQTPIIVLSVRSNSSDIVKALDLGADDYLVKPFDTEILLARIRANLRKSIKAVGATPVMQVGGIVMDTTKHQVTLDGREINLSPKEFKLLKYFMINAGKMVMHDQLLTELWGHVSDDNLQYLRIYVRQLRKKIETDPAKPSYITTEPGIGYRMDARS